MIETPVEVNFGPISAFKSLKYNTMLLTVKGVEIKLIFLVTPKLAPQPVLCLPPQSLSSSSPSSALSRLYNYWKLYSNSGKIAGSKANSTKELNFLDKKSPFLVRKHFIYPFLVPFSPSRSIFSSFDENQTLIALFGENWHSAHWQASSRSKIAHRLLE